MGSKDEAGAPWEHRYYKRVGRTAHTICWGIAIGMGSLLPAGAPMGLRAGHPVHAAQVTSGTPTPPAPPVAAPLPAQSSTPPEVPPKAGDVPDAAKVTQPAGAAAPALAPFALAWDDKAIPLIQSPEMIVTARLVIISGAAQPTEARLLTDGTRAWGGAPAMRQLV